jgi:hypothetical protein
MNVRARLLSRGDAPIRVSLRLGLKRRLDDNVPVVKPVVNAHPHPHNAAAASARKMALILSCCTDVNVVHHRG